ncbi:hypothetical protein [Frondihabitans sp. Leaf304]|uniref:hypothetical protein n=1 Tax=Frondihabitans sp. Leaf304 TaxID=1736329 RepID=UPI0012F91592|nr:hypothetical protein [Frondihabitans sp. Leaf304]
MNTSGGMSRVVGWISAAVLAALVTVFFAFVLQGGSCLDAAPGEGESSCTTGPAIGATAALVVGVVGSFVVILATARAIVLGRRLRRAPA